MKLNIRKRIRTRAKIVGRNVALALYERIVPIEVRDRYQVTVVPLEDWDFGFNDAGYPVDGPEKGMVYRWVAQVGVISIRRWTHETREEYVEDMKLRTRQSVQQRAQEERDAIDRYMESRQ